MKLFSYGLAVGIVCEIITLIFRFYYGLESTRDTTWIGNFTGNIRIHHGYIGIILILATIYKLRQNNNLSSSTLTSVHWLLILGIGLLISDLTHHFIILWILTGDHQFDLVYPV